MKFLASTLAARDVGGAAVTTTATATRSSPAAEHERERLRALVDLATWAEGVGYDAFGVGERHNPAFLSSAPAVLLGHIAARTSRIRLVTTVAVLSLADPVRAAEEYATLDQLSDGRLDLVIGKGNDPVSPGMFGVDAAELWDRLAENYELFRRLWREENVTWTGRFRPPLHGATTRPRPLQQPAPRVWHGSASSERSSDLAARWGDPLYSANGFRRTNHYLALVQRYRDRLVHHDHDPAATPLALGVHSPVITDRSQDALALARPAFAAFRDLPVARQNHFPFGSLEDFIDNGSALVGTADQIIEKLLDLHRRFGNQVLGIGVEGFFLTDPATTRAHLERFFAEVAPTLRAEVPSAVWTPEPPGPQDPGERRRLSAPPG
ncbi:MULTISPECIES: LLM class flavin-dependent oxidoreductase [Frankia]|uniref:LLM class flavin-dependent oxidoreductase n=1 Tax=Frankia TaxID=1854 RepID=UPI0003002114|nr:MULTISPECIES: LLM class flavin-dependent oxidoreductase [Frankia]